MRGRPLTPDQLRLAAEVYERTGNYQQAADAVGSDRSNVRRRLIAAGEPLRAELHVRACEKGLREGRAQLRKAGRAIEQLLAHAFTAHPKDIDAKEIAMLVNALTQTVQARVTVAAREDARRSARLTREKTRAEIRAINDDQDDESAEVNIYFAPPPGAEPEAADGLAAGKRSEEEAPVEVPQGPHPPSVGDLPL